MSEGGEERNNRPLFLLSFLIPERERERERERQREGEREREREREAPNTLAFPSLSQISLEDVIRKDKEEKTTFYIKNAKETLVLSGHVTTATWAS